MPIKETLRQIRASQPLNGLATSALRSLLRATGSKSEFLIKHLPRTGITSVELPNGRVLKLEAKEEEWIPTQIFWRGLHGYEPEMAGLFFRLAQSARSVLDVGAHAGLYSLLAGHANEQARVFAFEPLARVFSSLKRNVEINALTNVRCFSVAAGATSGIQEFYYPDQLRPLASSLHSDMLLATYPESEIKHVPVSVVTLDQFVADEQVSHVDVIKLDTERTEHDVLSGAEALLKRDRPTIFCEIWPDAGNQRQLESILRPLGYRFFHLLLDGPQERPEIVASEQYLNYLFSARAEVELKSTNE